MKQQRGGTFLGFIIGVVVGLACALAVAVYVTKVPVPFMNKGQTRSADQDVEENKKNKDWDPNAPLYGKNPAKPPLAAMPSLPAASEPVPVAAPAAATPAPAPAAAAKAEARAAASADPIGELAKSKAASSAAEPFVYWVQVGAYRTAEDAESQRAKLSLGGIETKVSEREQSGRTVFRLRVGPFDSKAEGEAAKEKLGNSGLETALVRVQR